MYHPVYAMLKDQNIFLYSLCYEVDLDYIGHHLVEIKCQEKIKNFY